MDVSGRARRSTWDVLVVLAALAPLVPGMRAVLALPAERFRMYGDFATLELQTRLVTTGGTLLGPYSRFGFNHPGPLYFYLLAPVYGLTGGVSRAMFLGPLVIAAAATIVVTFAVARLASRAHAFAVATVLVAWCAAFGSVATMPWNPMVIALPLVTFTVLAALAASGRLAALPAATFTGAFAAQTHLSCVPYVGALLAVAVVSGGLVVRRDRGGLRAARRPLLVASAVLGITSFPPLVEQLLPKGGNLSRIAKLFLDRPEPPKSWGETLTALARVSAWLPERVIEGKLAKEPIDPEPMWSAPFEPNAPTPSLALAAFVVVITAACLALAWRRRDRVVLALFGASLLGALVTAVALRGIVGVPFRYLLFWATTPAIVLAVACLASLAAFASERGARRAEVLGAGALVALALVAFGATRLTASAVTLRGVGVMPAIPGLPDAYAALVARLDRDGRVPVIHGGPGWHVNAATQLELVKDGRPLRVIAGERWLFGRQFPEPPPGNAGVVHVYAEHTPYPLTTKPCLELVAKAGEVSFYFAPEERLACDAPAVAPR